MISQHDPHPPAPSPARKAPAGEGELPGSAFPLPCWRFLPTGVGPGVGAGRLAGNDFTRIGLTQASFE